MVIKNDNMNNRNSNNTGLRMCVSDDDITKCNGCENCNDNPDMLYDRYCYMYMYQPCILSKEEFYK